MADGQMEKIMKTLAATEATLGEVNDRVGRINGRLQTVERGLARIEGSEQEAVEHRKRSDRSRDAKIAALSALLSALATGAMLWTAAAA